MLLKLGLKIGDRVQVHTASCEYCADQRRGASGRLGTIASIQEMAELPPPVDCPIDHHLFVLYDKPWSDGLPGVVRGQYFASDELTLS